MRCRDDGEDDANGHEIGPFTKRRDLPDVPSVVNENEEERRVEDERRKDDVLGKRPSHEHDRIIARVRNPRVRDEVACDKPGAELGELM